MASEPTGAAFTCALPASEIPAESQAAADRKQARSKGKVLIMDDEELIRDAAGKILSTAGYEVECARDSSGAIDLYRQAHEQGKAFDVVILDLTMPGGIGGKEVVKKLHLLCPGIKAILSSGYPHDPIMVNFREYGFIGVIAKPYRLREMTEIVGQAIGAVGAPS